MNLRSLLSKQEFYGHTIFQYLKHKTWINLHHMQPQLCTFQMLHSHSRLRKTYGKDVHLFVTCVLRCGILPAIYNTVQVFLFYHDFCYVFQETHGPKVWILRYSKGLLLPVSVHLKDKCAQPHLQVAPPRSSPPYGLQSPNLAISCGCPALCSISTTQKPHKTKYCIYYCIWHAVFAFTTAFDMHFFRISAPLRARIKNTNHESLTDPKK